MVRIALIVLISIHGLIHLIGFVKGFHITEVKALKGEVSAFSAMLWLMVTLLFLAAAVSYSLKSGSWWIFGITAVLISQILIIGHWSDAKFGSIVNLIVLCVSIAALGSWHFERSVSEELKEVLPFEGTSYSSLDEARLNNLPDPVRKWVKESGADKLPSRIHLEQTGRMRLKPEGEWMDVFAEQWFNLKEPGFFWKASVEGKLVSFKGRDFFNRSRSNMIIKLYSILPIVNESDKNIETGSAVRFLAEMVWFPSAAVADYLEWEALDDLNAVAKLRYPGHEVSVIYHFDEHGQVKSVEAERYNGQTGKLETWMVEIDSDSLVTLGNALVPARARVIWKLPAGEFCWYELSIREFE